MRLTSRQGEEDGAERREGVPSFLRKKKEPKKNLLANKVLRMLFQKIIPKVFFVRGHVFSEFLRLFRQIFIVLPTLIQRKHFLLTKLR